jgi:hypothetical protein
MASKDDDNKCKYVANDVKEEAEEVPLMNQKMIDNDNGNDNGDDNNGNDYNGNDDDNCSSTDDYSSEPEAEVSSEEEMNLPTSFEEELLN